MALVVADRVKETTTSTGTGPISLGGAEPNFRAFSSVLSDADTIYYAIIDNNNLAFEVGLGTYASSGDTITRTTVLSSSNSNSAVNFSAGTKDVILTYPADKSAFLDGSDQLVINGTAVTSTAADLNLVDGATADTVVNSKAVIYGAAGQVTANELDVDNIQIDANAIKSTDTNGNIQLFPNGTGFTELYGNTNAGKIRFNCEINTHGVTLAGPPHSAGATYTLELPNADGSSGQLLQTDGSGKLAFTSSLPGITASAAEINKLDGFTGEIGFRAVPDVGEKTSSYTLATGDVGKYVEVGSGGSITIPDATFTEGDVISIFNNTSGSITITCSITTAYIAGINTDQSSMTLLTRGIATVLFISGTVCVVSGSVS